MYLSEYDEAQLLKQQLKDMNFDNIGVNRLKVDIEERVISRTTCQYVRVVFKTNTAYLLQLELGSSNGLWVQKSDARFSGYHVNYDPIKSKRCILRKH